MSSDESTSSAEEFSFEKTTVKIEVEPLHTNDEITWKEDSQSTDTNNTVTQTTTNVNGSHSETIDDSTSSDEELSQISKSQKANVKEPVARNSILLSPTLLKRQYSKHFSSTEKIIALNIYKFIQQNSINYPAVKDTIKVTAQIMGGVSASTIANVLREYKRNRVLASPDRSKASANAGIIKKLDDSTLSAISRKIQTSFDPKDVPTLNDVLKVVNDDPELPTFSRTTLYNLLKKLNFTCSNLRRGILKKDIAKISPC
ncbi:uncharacterized protein LOC121737248 [Aricia agestis]|uniref:uncharacterized protein LOC121737248 n=1 Tax=Aricia agestis TaxID=91739 RepID=UPI001C20836F|nr:uncharacterized protein LOC121737248 [Aricia agestis]XP_041984797.1 uncharacterized protein LOC121737248 [Aricia agestis]XP_041984798.1 uncharacterized protein LOC121737248 [Aricia agestis]XP_041984799.1 uncharacterized protein LOC121737248 [Aricia agestis]